METPPTLIAVRWKPSRVTSILMNVLGTVVALAAGYLAFVLAFGIQDVTIILDLAGVGMAVVIILVSVVAHEGVHGLAILAYGGRPTFGAGLAGKILPYFYCTAPDQRFSVARYVVIALAPTVVINGVLVAGLLSSIAGWVVLPFAVHIAGCIGDWFLIAVALRAPRGSLVEDMKDGLVVYTVAP